MYGCESWTIKKAECRRIDAFELWCWRRLLRVPWTARRLNQSILKEINPEDSLEGLMLKLQYFGHLMWRADSLKKTLMLGKTEGRRRRGRQRMRWLASVTTSMDMNLSKLREIVKDREAWRAAVHGVPKSWTRLSDGTTTVSQALSCPVTLNFQNSRFPWEVFSLYLWGSWDSERFSYFSRVTQLSKWHRQGLNAGLAALISHVLSTSHHLNALCGLGEGQHDCLFLFWPWAKCCGFSGFSKPTSISLRAETGLCMEGITEAKFNVGSWLGCLSLPGTQLSTEC